MLVVKRHDLDTDGLNVATSADRNQQNTVGSFYRSLYERVSVVSSIAFPSSLALSVLGLFVFHSVFASVHTSFSRPFSSVSYCLVVSSRSSSTASPGLSLLKNKNKQKTTF